MQTRKSASLTDNIDLIRLGLEELKTNQFTSQASGLRFSQYTNHTTCQVTKTNTVYKIITRLKVDKPGALVIPISDMNVPVWSEGAIEAVEDFGTCVRILNLRYGTGTSRYSVYLKPNGDIVRVSDTELELRSTALARRPGMPQSVTIPTIGVEINNIYQSTSPVTILSVDIEERSI